MTEAGLSNTALRRATEIGKQLGPETRSRDFGELFQVRWGAVTARNPTTGTVTVEIGKDTDSPVPDMIIVNPGYYPRVGDEVMIALQGRGGVVLGAKNAQIGHLRLTGATDVTLEQLPSHNLITWQTQLEDTDNIWSSGATVTIPWPGVWIIKAQLEISGGSSAHRRIADLVVDGVRMDRDDQVWVNANVMTLHLDAATFLAEGTDITVNLDQTGGGAETLEERVEDTPTFSATWIGPGS